MRWTTTLLIAVLLSTCAPQAAPVNHLEQYPSNVIVVGDGEPSLPPDTAKERIRRRQAKLLLEQARRALSDAVTRLDKAK